MCREVGDACRWYTEATYVWVEPFAGSPSPYSTRFPVESRIYWQLTKSTDLRGTYQLTLRCEEGGSGGQDIVGRWYPADVNWDPLFDTSAQDFNFYRIGSGASRFPSIVNCDWPGGCGGELIPDGSNLPQTVTLTPSCFVATDACKAACEQSISGSEIGCGDCSTYLQCPAGDFPATCTWEWNSGSGIWEVTSNDCSNSSDSGCSCVPMMDGCDTQAPGIFEPSIYLGPCSNASSYTAGVKACT